MTHATKLLVLIPTRNRCELAFNAVESVLQQINGNAQGIQSVQVVVSDNWTEAEGAQQLEKFCKARDVPYIKPPSVLAMTAHWEWAWHAVLEKFNATHICYLTDRMILRRGAIGDLLQIIHSYPEKIISYNHDRINDYVNPIQLEEERWSGRLFEIDSEQLLYLTAQSLPATALPRALNCVVPREFGTLIKQRFGSVFGSLSPDYCFAFRALSQCNSLLFYDKSLLVHYAQARSNGASNTRGITTQDSRDFMKSVAPGELHAAAPVPEFLVVGNAIMHEYEIVRRETQDARFPPIDFDSYLAYMHREIEGIENPQLRERMETLWQQQSHNLSIMSAQAISQYPAWQQSLRRKAQRVLWLARNHRYQPFWLFLKRRLGKVPTDLEAVITECATSEEALSYASVHHRPASAQDSNLEMLIRLKELPFHKNHWAKAL